MIALVRRCWLLTAISHDGSLSTIDRTGKLLSTKPLSAVELQEAIKQHTPPADPLPTKH